MELHGDNNGACSYSSTTRPTILANGANMSKAVKDQMIALLDKAMRDRVWGSAEEQVSEQIRCAVLGQIMERARLVRLYVDSSWPWLGMRIRTQVRNDIDHQ